MPPVGGLVGRGAAAGVAAGVAARVGVGAAGAAGAAWRGLTHFAARSDFALIVDACAIKIACCANLGSDRKDQCA